MYNLKVKLYPISIDKNELGDKPLNEVVFLLVNEGLKKLCLNDKIKLEDCNLIENYNAGGYGEISKNELTAIDTLAKTEGILLDPVYTGRAFYGMLDMLKNNKLPKNSTVLFWHTGGIPANFYYADKLI